MNLTNLFNLNFLKENIRRSKAVILLLTLLVPVINVIYYLMGSASSSIITPNIMNMQPLSILGMYIIPVILSLTLFSFIYKRKSSDFVMSFPVSKKQIFISNTLGGILIIMIMNIVNYLFTLIASLLLSNVLLDYSMLFDMFVLWTISYIFVFTCTNIGVALSSNKITTIVVTLLVLFLVPFTHTFITSDDFKGVGSSDIETYCNNELCKPKYYDCFSTACEIKKSQNIYPYTHYDEIENTTSYTMPYALIYGAILEDIPSINKSIVKMSILSIIYIILGVLLFTRRKLEIVETSFKSERLHHIIRSLTAVPIICIYYVILSNSNIGLSDIFTITFLVVLLIAYIIIYDLITRKKVTNLLKSIAALIIVGIIVIFTGELSSNEELKQINVDDIDKMMFIDYDMVNKKGYTKDKDLINYVMSIHINNVKGEENYYRNFDVRISVDNKVYEFGISTTKEEYNYIINTLSKDKTYQKTSNKIKNKDIFALQVQGDHSYLTKDNKLYSKLINEFQKSNVVRSETSNSLFGVVLSTYDNFETNNIYYDITDIKLQEEILNHYNKEVTKAFEDPDVNVHTYYIGTYDENTYTTSEDYLSNYYKEENIEINKFILSNINEKVDITKEYKYIKFYTDNRYKSTNIFVTNKVEELDTLIEKLKQKEEEERQKYNTGDTYDKYTY